MNKVSPGTRGCTLSVVRQLTAGHGLPPAHGAAPPTEVTTNRETPDKTNPNNMGDNDLKN